MSTSSAKAALCRSTPAAHTSTTSLCASVSGPLSFLPPGLEHYRPEAVLAHPLEGTPVPALCYNLREAPGPHERNPDYATRLQRVLSKLNFPPAYVAGVS